MHSFLQRVKMHYYGFQKGINKMSGLNYGDVIYKMRHGVACEKITITTNEGGVAVSDCGQYKFNLHYTDPPLLVKSNFGFNADPWHTYILADPDMIPLYDRTIKERFIRNFKFSTLSEGIIDSITKILQENG